MLRMTFGMLLAITIIGGALLPQASSAQETETALNYKMKTLDGKDITLDKYKGKVLLIVNVASKCGLTPQYKGLQALHDQYGELGLAVLGFPCNQFGGQEPGTPAEIQTFCSSKYDVSFDMFDKVDVNGEKACDLYKHLTSLELKPAGSGDIGWNFEKFLVDRNGEVVARFSPKTAPDSPEIVNAVRAQLADE